MKAVHQQSTDSLLLPSQFFADENDVFPANNNKLWNQNWSSSSGSSDFGSSMSSPLDSELGSTESESDQDDEYIAELTRQMAQYMLQDDDELIEHPKGEAAVLWSESDSQEQAPPIQNLDKLTINEAKPEYESSNEFTSTSPKPTSAQLAVEKTSSYSVEFQSKQALIDEQIRAAIQLRKQSDQEQKQQAPVSREKQANRHNQTKPKKREVKQSQDKEIAFSCGGFGYGQEVSAMADLQQEQNKGSEMKAVFLGDQTGSGSGSCGTGVFLPRGTCNTTSTTTTLSRKKPAGCATVIIPARVAQSLKLHFDKMGPTSRSTSASFPLQQDVLVTGDVRYVLQPKPKSKSRKASSLKNHKDIGLPQEWTY